MSQRANPTLVGGFVVAGVLLAVGSILLLGSGKFFHKTHPFILYFEGNVNGLRMGSPVKFQGVDIGSVTSIRLRFTQAGATMIIPVTIVLDESRIESISGTDVSFESSRFRKTIEQGLRARLETESLLTGQRYVALHLAPGSPVNLIGDSPGIEEIPTLPTTFEEVTSAISQFLVRLKEMNVDKMVNDLAETSRVLRELVASPDVKAIPKDLAQTLDSIDQFIRRLHAEIEPFSPRLMDATVSVHDVANELEATLEAARPAVEDLRETARRAEKELALTLEAARALMDPNAPLVAQLQATLKELGAAARSLRALAELVERDPGSLLRGRDTSNP